MTFKGLVVLGDASDHIGGHEGVCGFKVKVSRGKNTMTQVIYYATPWCLERQQQHRATLWVTTTGSEILSTALTVSCPGCLCSLQTVTAKMWANDQVRECVGVRMCVRVSVWSCANFNILTCSSSEDWMSAPHGGNRHFSWTLQKCFIEIDTKTIGANVMVLKYSLFTFQVSRFFCVNTEWKPVSSLNYLPLQANTPSLTLCLSCFSPSIVHRHVLTSDSQCFLSVHSVAVAPPSLPPKRLDSQRCCSFQNNNQQILYCFNRDFASCVSINSLRPLNTWWTTGTTQSRNSIDVLWCFIFHLRQQAEWS